MNMLAQKQRLIAWLAFVAILFNALVPSISHAVVAAQGKQVPWEQICSATGIKFNASPVSSGKEAPSSPMAGSMQDCAYCSAHAGSDFVASTELPASILFFNADTFSITPSFAPASSHVWASKQPRAPPHTLI